MQDAGDGEDDGGRPAIREEPVELDDGELAEPRARGSRVVGIGGSAGSILAMQRFFGAMPSDSGMVFVVVLHSRST